MPLQRLDRNARIVTIVRDHVIGRIKHAPIQRTAKRCKAGPITMYVPESISVLEGCTLAPARKDRDVMPLIEQYLRQPPADEPSPTYYEYIHFGKRLNVRRST
jgi:hypothetical protein